MIRVTLGFKVNLNAAGSTFGIDMSLGVGQGPTTFTIAPQALTGSSQARFNLSDLMKSMGEFLKIPALVNISQWVDKVPRPFNKIFAVEIEPEIQVSIAKGQGDGGGGDDSPPSGIRCILKLFEDDQYGVRLPGPDLPSWLTIEPDFTVYQLLIGYGSGEGLDIKAEVEFHDRASGPKRVQMLDTGAARDKPAQGKKEIISYPFLPAETKPPLFELCYLGLGQRFGPTVDMNASDPMQSVLDELRNNLKSNNPQDVLKKVETYYHADRGWFIAADLMVQGWRVGVIFNDPVLYGLRISCNSNQFKGLLIEILYQKLGPHLGVFYGALQLPESMRTIQLEYGSLTIPSFRIWIYTNGDFKVAVGWPLGDNSIGVQVLVFTGGGGFYFAKLRSGDNPQSPKQLPAPGDDQPPAAPDYNPILAFGLGLWLGLGRSLHMGVLSAEVSLTLQGTFQGVIAWKSPGAENSATLSKPPDYYWFAATVGIVGVLQGEVDLKVISAGVLVRLSVTAGVAFEKGYGTEVMVSATVNVETHVKIVFVKIGIHFRKSFSIGFTLISSPNGLATIAGPLNPSFHGIVPKALPTRALEWRSIEASFDSGTIAAYLAPGSRITLDVYFLLQPSAVYTDTDRGGVLHGVAMLLVPSPVTVESPQGASGDSPDPLAEFYLAFARWLLCRYSKRHLWHEVATALHGEKPDQFDEELVAFFCKEVNFLLHPIDLTQTDAEEMQMAIFPMFPELQMKYDGSDTPVDFNACTTPAHYADAVRQYFKQLSLNGLMGNPSTTQLPKSLPKEMLGPSVTRFMFFDYFHMIGRDMASQLAEQQAKPKEGQNNEITARIPMPDAKMVRQISGLVSRFCWNALRLPRPDSIASGDPYLFQMEGAYCMTGQQFAVDASKHVCRAALSIAHPESDLSRCIQFATEGSAGEDQPQASVISCMPVAPLPPSPPSPIWSSQTLLMAAKAMGAEVHVAQMPGVHSQPAWYTVRRPLQWRDPSTSRADETGYTSLVPLPIDLVQLAKDRPLNLQVALEWPEDNGDDALQDMKEKMIHYTPALFIQLKIGSAYKTRNVNVTSEGQPVREQLKHLYQLYSTDDETREMIGQALNSDTLPHASISLLYNAEQSGYTSDNLDLKQHPVFINKINLSTLSQPDDMMPHFMKSLPKGDKDDLGPTSAMLDDVEDFLRLVWEVSVVNAPGFFLHYEDADGRELDDALFANGPADLGILVEFAENAPVQVFHNFIKITNTKAVDHSVFIGATYQEQGKPQPALQYHPTVPAGCIGFDIDWRLQTEKLSRADADVLLYSEDYFAQLYHLIQFQVQKTDAPDRPAFRQSLWSMALTSSSDQSDEQHQTYKQVVPVYQFMDGNNDREPLYYDAVGGEPRLLMRLMDLFGNTLGSATYTVDFPVLYHDRLVAVDEWPGVASTYLFTRKSGKKPVLRLSLSFNPQSIVSGGTGNGSNTATPPDGHQRQSIQTTLLQYKSIIAQLSDPHEHLSLSTSVLVKDQGIVAEGKAVRRFLLDAAREFQEVLFHYDPKKGSAGLHRVARFGIDITDVCNQPKDLFDIRVWLTFERDADLIDPSAQNGKLPEVQKKVQQIQPDFSVPEPKGSDPSKTPPKDRYGVRHFVRKFEAAFAGFDQEHGKLRVLTRSGKDNLAGTSEIAFLWAMRWSDHRGVSLEVNPDAGVAYFTMAPLSTRLFNQTAEVVHYNANLDPEPSRQAFSNIDLDIWAQAFLGVLGKALSPDLAAAVARTDKQSYHTLMKHKSYLAKSLTEGLVPIFDLTGTADDKLGKKGHRQVVDGSLEEAKELFEQSLLNLLTKAYSTSALVQVPVKVKVSDQTDAHPPQLYGSIEDPTREKSRGKSLDKAPPKKEYTLSSSRLKLETGVKYLGFMVAAARPKTVKELKLELAYDVNYTEFMFKPKEDEYGYTPSSWLKYAVTDDASMVKVPLGSFDIPIPLREYPDKPILIGQEQIADSEQKSFLAKELEKNPIADALKWDFSTTVTCPNMGSQDMLWMILTYNQGLGDAGTDQAMTPKASRQNGYKGDLNSVFKAMARFITAYAQIEPWLEKLPQMAQAPSGQEGGPNAVKIVHVLVQEIVNVSANWGAYRRIRDKYGNLIFPLLEPEAYDTKAIPKEEIQTYVIEFPNLNNGPDEKGAEGKKRLTVYVDAETSHLPLINGQQNLKPLEKVPQGEGPGSDKQWHRTTYRAHRMDKMDPDRLHFVWPNLEILKRQTANTAFWIVRNSDLLRDGSLRTNQKLIYKTDTVQFSNPVIPRVSVDHIQLTEGQALETYLNQILEPLTEAGVAVSKNRSIMMQLGYTFTLSWRRNRNSDDRVMSSIPILLVDNASVRAQDSGNGSSGIDLKTFVANLSSDIRTWYAQTKCSTANASILADVTLFAGIEGTKLPLVRLNQIEILVPSDWWKPMPP